MIHVQIASQLTAQGLSGVRWVLVETVDAMQASQPAPAVALAAQHAAAAEPPAAATAPSTDGLRLAALKLVVVVLGLGAALYTARVQVGPPGALPGPRPAASAPVTPMAPAAAPVLRQLPATTPPPPSSTSPASAPAATMAEPPLPAASATLPRLTAAL